jgi:ribosome-associated protein
MRRGSGRRLENEAKLMHIPAVQTVQPAHCRNLANRRVLKLRLNAQKQEPKGLTPRRAKSAAAASTALAHLIATALDDAKAEEIVTIDLKDKTSLADYMIVASGRSQRHVGAIADKLLDKLKENGIRDTRVEGMQLCDWVLIDAGDIIVHVFRPEARAFYNIEKMWGADKPKLETAQ